MNLTAEQLGAIIKQDGEALSNSVVRAKLWLPHITETMSKSDIETPLRVAAFVAQMALESGGFRILVENLNYSAQGLANTWARYSATGKRGGPPNALALKLARNPQAIANNVYADRMGNGPESQGWGWKYRGRGLKQVTGHDNYERCGRFMGLPLLEKPELLELPQYAALSAGWFWDCNNLEHFADARDFKGLTKAINGGLTGYDDNDRSDRDTRMDYYVVACKVLGV